jgi:hypothetical protein
VGHPVPSSVQVTVSPADKSGLTIDSGSRVANIVLALMQPLLHEHCEAVVVRDLSEDGVPERHIAEHNAQEWQQTRGAPALRRYTTAVRMTRLDVRTYMIGSVDTDRLPVGE